MNKWLSALAVLATSSCMFAITALFGMYVLVFHVGHWEPKFGADTAFRWGIYVTAAQTVIVFFLMILAYLLVRTHTQVTTRTLISASLHGLAWGTVVQLPEILPVHPMAQSLFALVVIPVLIVFSTAVLFKRLDRSST